MKKYLLFFFMSLFLCTCKKDSLDENIQNNAYLIIRHAEQMPVEELASEIIKTLNEIPDVDDLNIDLQIRWCITYGKAANELLKNELLPIVRFAKIYNHCLEYGTLIEKAYITFFLANAYLELREGNRASELYFDALQLAENSKDNKLIGDISYALGRIYDTEEKDADAELFFKKSAYYYGLANNLVGLVNSICNIAYTFYYRDSLQAALCYTKQAENIVNGNLRMEAIVANTFARIYKEYKEYDRAKSYILESIEKDINNQAPHYIVLSEIYILQKEYNKALECLNNAEQAPSLNRYTPKTIAKYRYKIADILGKPDEAEFYKKRYEYLRDFLIITSQKYQIDIFITQLAELEKEIKETKLLNVKDREDRRIIKNIVSVIAILLFILVFIFIINPQLRFRTLRKLYSETITEFDGYVKDIEEIRLKKNEEEKLLKEEIRSIENMKKFLDDENKNFLEKYNFSLNMDFDAFEKQLNQKHEEKENNITDNENNVK